MRLYFDKWNSGEIEVEKLEENEVAEDKNFFQMRKTKKSKLVSTDYTTYVLLYACNDESWWKSVDMYSIFLRRIDDDASTALTVHEETLLGLLSNSRTVL